MAATAQQPKRDRVQKTRESVRHAFTNDEILEMSRQLARAHQDVGELEEQKKKVMADFAASIQTKTSIVADLSRRINNGHEYRMVDCELRFHDPEKGMKTLVRLDTGEEVKTTKMESYELQDVLFEETDPMQGVLSEMADQINAGALDSADGSVTVQAKAVKR